MLACLSTDQILAIAAIGVLIVYVFIWWYTRKMAKASIEASRVQATLAFFTVYEKIITRHQREVQQTWLARVIEEMRSGVLLKRIDGTEPKIGSAGSRTYDQAIGSITAVSYYFNDIGAQLKGVWEDLPESLKTSIFKTLSSEVGSVWGFVDQYKGLIAPVRSLDWLSSLKWLSETFEEMKKKERKKYSAWARNKSNP